MSWQLGAFALLGLALAIGFAWYERSKPDARIVALVATLAAFAALGRIAFAAIPNVKPTTDIVLISGYALGGGPGFVVGALAGLTSNFFFGQGPWTPWQMAAWGATGLIGAGLATVTRGRITRWPLAIACAVVGFGFTAAQDLGDWVNYSDHSLAQLGVYVGKGVGFDLVHAAGCLAFALAFGPALTRSIARFAQRLSVAWRTFDGTAVPLLAVVCCVAALAPAPARAAAGRDPVSYLLAAQHRDGGFGSGPGAPSSQLYAGWAALGLAAAGHNPIDVSHGGRSLLGYIGTGGYPDTGSLERTILAVRAAGISVAHLRRPRSARRARAADQGRWLALRTGQLDCVRRTRAAQRRRCAAAQDDPLDRSAAGRRRRLQFRQRWRRQRHRRHRRGARGAWTRGLAFEPGGRATSGAIRTSTAASRVSPAVSQTRSRRRGRHRDCCPLESIPGPCIAVAPYRRSPSCGRSSPAMATFATRARPIRHPCGSRRRP